MNNLWSYLTSPTQPERGITYFIKSPERVWGGRSTSPDHFERVLANMLHNRNTVYVNINPSSHDGAKGTSQDVTHWNHILLDIDPVANGAQPESALADLTRVLLSIDSGLPRCLSVIDSGRGIQAWLALWPMTLDSDDTRRRVEHATAQFLRKLNEGLETHGHGCVIDTSCSDLARVARPPGSFNAKTGRVSKFILNPASRYDPAKLLALAGPYVQPVVPPKLTETTNLIKVLPHLTEKAATFILEGVREPGRHQAAYATAANLAELGVQQEQAEKWMGRGALMCSPPLKDSDLLRAIAGAYRKVYGKETEATR